MIEYLLESSFFLLVSLVSCQTAIWIHVSNSVSHILIVSIVDVFSYAVGALIES